MPYGVITLGRDDFPSPGPGEDRNGGRAEGEDFAAGRDALGHSCFPLSRTTGQSRYELDDRRIKIGVSGAAVDVMAGQGNTGAGGEFLSVRGAVMPAKHDFRRQRVAGETRHFGKFQVHECVQCRAQTEMMRSDVDWKSSHRVVVHRWSCGWLLEFIPGRLRFPSGPGRDLTLLVACGPKRQF